MTVLVGLDLSPSWCGACTGRGDARPTTEAWELPKAGDDLGWMLDLYDRFLATHIEATKPDVIVYESPILVPGRDKLINIRRIYALGSHTEFVCRRWGIEVGEVDLKEAKRELAGFAGAKKADMVAVAERVGIILPAGGGKEDAADAFGVWLVGLRAVAPDLSRQWDRRVWSRRGDLL